MTHQLDVASALRSRHIIDGAQPKPFSAETTRRPGKRSKTPSSTRLIRLACIDWAGPTWSSM